jgi:enolase
MIKSVKACQILDSRGKPTVKAELTTNLGKFYSSVPSGTSTGKFEAQVKEIKTAIKNINKIINPAIKGENEVFQEKMDNLLIKLDGTKNKSHLGANAILAVSLAVLRAGARAQKLFLWQWISEISEREPNLPYPSVLQIEGGLHGDGGVDVQEFMAVFQGKSFKENFEQGKKIYKTLRKILLKEYGQKGIKLGMEGAFIPPMKRTEDVLNAIIAAAKKEKVEKKIKIILDIAASHENPGLKLSHYLNLIEQYPIIGLEDCFSENDWKNWQKLSLELKNKNLLIIGDDLTVTNPKRIRQAQEKKACNGIIIKPNQIGTISETIKAANLAKSFDWKIIVSHRSGETMDDFIADLAVGLGADFIKAGSPSKPERMVKYKRLLKIEKELYEN